MRTFLGKRLDDGNEAAKVVSKEEFNAMMRDIHWQEAEADKAVRHFRRGKKVKVLSKQRSAEVNWAQLGTVRICTPAWSTIYGASTTVEELVYKTDEAESEQFDYFVELT